MISVIITAYNESSCLGRAMSMIMDARPECEFEVILIDDRSTDDTGNALSGILAEASKRNVHLHIIRNLQRLGVSGSRRSGADTAKGDVLCFLDAHVFPDVNFFDTLNSAVEEHPLSIVAPGLTEHRLTDPWTPLPETPRSTNYGGGFTFTFRKFWFYMSVNKRRVRWQQRRGAYACGMTMTRTLYNHLGGWANLPGFWSSSDVTMCMKAWFMDVPIVIETATQHYHGVRGFGPHETPKWHEVINRFYAAKVLFSPECYRDWWAVGLRKRFGRHWTEKFDQILGSRAVEAERRHVLNRKRHSNEEFLDNFVYPRLDKAGLPHEP